jgi:hypothetical protein
MITLKNPQKLFLIALLTLTTASTTALAKERKAVISTSEGDITVKLFSDETPKTVQNFIGLSNGNRQERKRKIFVCRNYFSSNYS